MPALLVEVKAFPDLIHLLLRLDRLEPVLYSLDRRSSSPGLILPGAHHFLHTSSASCPWPEPS